MKVIKNHSKIALAYFLLIAVLGVVLRAFFLLEIPLKYKFIVHAHSHIALLGWVYTAITTLIYYIFLKDNIKESKYKKLFFATQITLVGMLFTFPFMGYKLFSIVFSTLFLFTSYVFVYFFFKYTTAQQKATTYYLLVRNALGYMTLSTLGPLSLGIIMNTVGKSSALYRNSIYFYLHFQYNGWFIVALLGVFLFILKQINIELPKKSFKHFYLLFNLGVLLTFSQSLLWMKSTSILINVIAIIGSLMQIIAFVILIKHSIANKETLKKGVSTLVYCMLKVVSILFAVKLVMQLAGSFPIFANAVTTNIDLVIGYLHWVFLGIVTISLFAFLNHFKFIKLNKTAFIIYLIGFLATEVLLFYRGASVFIQLTLSDDFSEYIVIVSAFLLIGIVIINGLQVNYFKKFSK